MADRPPDRPNRKDYIHFQNIQTRWMDNDLYGHVNNVTYYSYFDTAVNLYLIHEGGLDIQEGAIVGYAIETNCRFFAPIAYPELLETGLRVGHLGNSSVRYEVAIFRPGEDDPVAAGYFVHVFVDRASDKPTPIPPPIRGALEKLLVPAA